MLKALAIIVGPIVCGAVYLAVAGPPLTPGVYLEIRGRSYLLPACTASTTPAPVAVGIGRGQVNGFVIVSGDDDPNPVNAELAQLFLLVVDHTAPDADLNRTRVAATARRQNRRAVHVEPAARLQWDAVGSTGAFYHQAVARQVGDRSTMELLAELEIPALNGAFCRYRVVLGPQPRFVDEPAQWFLKLPEGKQ